MKRIFALIFTIVLIFALSLPCFADTWGNVAPNVSSYVSISSVNDFMTNADYSALIEIARKAEQIGLFGGGTVVGLSVYWKFYDGRNDYYEIYAYVVGPVNPSDVNGIKINQFDGYITTDGIFRVRSYYSDGSIRNTIGFSTYRLTSDGSWQIQFSSSSGGTRTDVQLKTTNDSTWGSYLITMRNFNGDFVTPENYTPPISDGVISGALQTMIDNYNLALQGTGGGGTPERQDDGNYFLDIPAIITSLPLAASAILTNAFDFELFGINIAGFLSVILVITIIGWLVWLLIFKK